MRAPQEQVITVATITGQRRQALGLDQRGRDPGSDQQLELVLALAPLGLDLELAALALNTRTEATTAILDVMLRWLEEREELELAHMKLENTTMAEMSRVKHRVFRAQLQVRHRGIMTVLGDLSLQEVTRKPVLVITTDAMPVSPELELLEERSFRNTRLRSIIKKRNRQSTTRARSMVESWDSFIMTRIPKRNILQAVTAMVAMNLAMVPKLPV